MASDDKEKTARVQKDTNNAQVIHDSSFNFSSANVTVPINGPFKNVSQSVTSTAKKLPTK